MTVASDTFGRVSQSGSGASWQNTSRLTLGVGISNCFYSTSIPPNLLLLSKPDALNNIVNGSRLTNIKVTMRPEIDPSGGPATVKWNGTIAGVSKSGSLKNFIAGSSAVEFTFDGDAAYWGFSAYDAKDWLIAVRDGTLKFEIDMNPQTSSGECKLSNVACEVTYELVDTKRAAIVTCVP